jgi:hypothetical protein
MNSELLAFANLIGKQIAALKAELSDSRFHMQKRAEIAARYNVNATLFRGEGFWRECARKAACRELKSE